MGLKSGYCPHGNEHCNSMKPSGDMMCLQCYYDWDAKEREDGSVPASAEGGGGA